MSNYNLRCIKYVFIVLQAIATVTTASVVLVSVIRIISVTAKGVYPVSGHCLVLMTVAKVVVIKPVINGLGIVHLAMTVIMVYHVIGLVIRTV